MASSTANLVNQLNISWCWVVCWNHIALLFSFQTWLTSKTPPINHQQQQNDGELSKVIGCINNSTAKSNANWHTLVYFFALQFLQFFAHSKAESHGYLLQPSATAQSLPVVCRERLPSNSTRERGNIANETANPPKTSIIFSNKNGTITNYNYSATTVILIKYCIDWLFH